MTALSAAVLLVAAAGCNSHIGNPEVCGNDGGVAGCGTSCSGTQDCQAGSYCGAGGTCTADCNANTPCASGTVCNAHGQCVAGNSDGGAFADASGFADADCPSINVDVKPIIPTVELLIDQSGSMNNVFDSTTGVTRWQAVGVALTDATNGVVTVLQDKVRFGATLYTSKNGTLDGGTCPILTSVPAMVSNLGPITNLLANNQPVSDTPTGESLEAVAATLSALPPIDPNNPEPKIIALATDGEPDSCSIPNPSNSTESQQTQAVAIKGAQDAFHMGIKTYILSVGSGVSDAHLQQMANAGLGLPVDGSGGNAPFFKANNQQQMIDAFNQIIRGARSCDFTLSGQVQMGQANQGVVTLNGNALTYGTDWTLTDPSTLELTGNACTQFKNADQAKLTAVFPCGTVVQ